MNCTECGQDYRATHAVKLGTGYAHTPEGKAICYDCCAIRDRAKMVETGSSSTLPLYLDETRQALTNWPGTLSFPVDEMSHGNHNMAGSRVDVWFKGPDGRAWHGTLYGENTMVCHCKRTLH